jgi:hypothetical protein
MHAEFFEEATTPFQAEATIIANTAMMVTTTRISTRVNPFVFTKIDGTLF